jgi:CDGSH-type Zn-finger protein/uncharacterized Fe-S cluster protein YjdI
MPDDLANPFSSARENILYVLTEAAEIEHGLMCCYLYAAWSLKRPDDPGLSPAQAQAVGRWRRSILAVAQEEMTHLTLVNNILVALGAAPHLMRQNLPVGAGYHPSNLVVALAPFDMATIAHFLFLERPHQEDIADSPEFRPAVRYRRGQPGARLNPTAQDYDTVGELYRLIEDSLDHLAGVLGEDALFTGDPALQIDAALSPLPGIATVTNLASAKAALETIIAQGEGSVTDHETSHYVRFAQIRDEYQALLAQDPAFVPAYPAARNPVLRRPPAPEGKVHIVEPIAVETADVAAALYGLMLRALQLVWALPAGETLRRPAFGLSVAAMRGMTALAENLARLPARHEGDAVNAGFPFTISRSFALPYAGPAAPRLLAERTREIVAALRPIIARVPAVAGIADQLDEIASALGDGLGARKAAEPPPVVPIADAPDTRPASDPVEIARGQDLEIRFHGKRCIHHRHCVLGAPETFLANTPGEWIFPDRTPTERLVAIAQACPSGAIRYARLDGGAEESPPPVNAIRLRENGPLAVMADLRLGDAEPQVRATLCRCGASKNKPFCDGSHAAAGFQATGEPASLDTAALPNRDGPFIVRPLADGPLQVTGAVEICAGTGRVVHRTTDAKLCRCGGSRNKPLCDGSHLSNGFTAPGWG